MKRSTLIVSVLILLLSALAACLALFFKSSGCGTDSGFVTGERTIMANGVERVYYLKLPEPYDASVLIRLYSAFMVRAGTIQVLLKGIMISRVLSVRRQFSLIPTGLPMMPA